MSHTLVLLLFFLFFFCNWQDMSAGRFDTCCNASCRSMLSAHLIQMLISCRLQRDAPVLFPVRFSCLQCKKIRMVRFWRLMLIDLLCTIWAFFKNDFLSLLNSLGCKCFSENMHKNTNVKLSFILCLDFTLLRTIFYCQEDVFFC